MYPLRIREVSDAHTREKSIVRIDLDTLAGTTLDSIDCDRIDFHLSADDTTAQTVYLWLARYLAAIRVEINGTTKELSTKSVIFPGFAPEEALLPYPRNVFDGYRLLQEYFIFPQRFHFFSLTGLRSLWPATAPNDVRLEFHFSRPMPANVRLRTADVSLYCAPAVNLFEHDAEPIDLDGRAANLRLRPAGQRPECYEIFSIDHVCSWQRHLRDTRDGPLRVFRPFESFQHEIEHAQGVRQTVKTSFTEWPSFVATRKAILVRTKRCHWR